MGNERELTYRIRVSNAGREVHRDVVVTVEAPEATLFRSSQNPPTVQVARRSTDGRTVEFLPVNAIRSGETLTYNVVVQRQSGAGPYAAKVTSRESPEGILVGS